MLDPGQPPSTEPPSVAPEVLKDIPDDIGFAACPDYIKDVVFDVIEAYDVSPRMAAAVALHVATTAIGGSAAVCSGFREVLPAFNLVVALQEGRAPGWFKFLLAPLITEIFAMQHSLAKHGAAVLEQDAKQHEAALRAAKQSMAPDPDLIRQGENQARRLKAGIKPAVITERMDAKFLERVVEQSFDGMVLLTDLVGDPVEGLLLLKPAERRQLAHLLKLSWEGLPLSFGLRQAQGTLSALWLIHESNLIPLFECEEITGGSNPAPFLFIQSPGNGIRPDPPKMQSAAAWKQAIEVLFHMRCGQNRGRYHLSEDAESLLGAFEAKVKMLALGEEAARHVGWLPDFARKLALVFCIFDLKSRGAIIGPQHVIDAIVVAEWLGFAHLAVVQSFADCGSFRPAADKAAATDLGDPLEVMLRKIRQKAPVSRRELWRSYDKPRAMWFQANLDALLASGKITEEGNRFVVTAESRRCGSDDRDDMPAKS